MRLKFLFFVPVSLFCACSGEPADSSDMEGEVGEEVTYCDCKELQFDQPYNNFYLEKPRDGFTGLCENLYSNGLPSLSKNFKKGKVHGKVISYYENGQIDEEKEFDMNFQVNDHFKYDESGNLIFHYRYERGKLIESVYP